MYRFYLRVLIYIICFVMVLFGMSSFDYNRFIKQGKVAQGWILYFAIAFALAYLVGSFLMSIIYYFN